MKAAFRWAKPMTRRLDRFALMYIAIKVQMASSRAKIQALAMTIRKFSAKTT